jgi:6-phosphofructokinase 1
MARTFRRVGVLTGGGDCPGLNAVIRAVAKGLFREGVSVVGIEDGYLGLVENRMRELDHAATSDILTLGGTILGTNNTSDPARFFVGRDAAGNALYESRIEQCLAHASAAGIEALVVVGGDGSMTCAQPFAKAGLPVVGVPKTIDNDIEGTDLTFGFQSAVAIATDALDRLHTTAASHHRAMICEVMGRNAGWIALHAGVASGSDVILLPEIPFEFEHVAALVERRASRGRRFTILCVSEGAAPVGGTQVVRRLESHSHDPKRLGGIGALVAAELELRTKVSTRHVVLGHIQRGGSPIAADRVLGTEFGAQAVRLLTAGRAGRMVAWVGGRVTDVPIEEPAGRQRRVPVGHSLVAAARSVYTSFGDAPPTAGRKDV